MANWSIAHNRSLCALPLSDYPRFVVQRRDARNRCGVGYKISSVTCTGLLEISDPWKFLRCEAASVSLFAWLDVDQMAQWTLIEVHPRYEQLLPRGWSRRREETFEGIKLKNIALKRIPLGLRFFRIFLFFLYYQACIVFSLVTFAFIPSSINYRLFCLAE